MSADLFQTIPPIILSILGLLFLVSFIRLIKGPHLPDRIIVLDFMSVLAIAFMAVFALWNKASVFLDAAAALALISFLGTVAFAKYLEKSRRIKGKDL